MIRLVDSSRYGCLTVLGLHIKKGFLFSASAVRKYAECGPLLWCTAHPASNPIRII